MLVRGCVLAALAMQSFALTVRGVPDTLTASAPTISQAVVAVQPTTTPTAEATTHHYHHWTYVSSAFPSRKPCSTHLSSVPSSKATPASSTSPVSSSSPASGLHTGHHHHHHQHTAWSYISSAFPTRKPCSAHSSSVPSSKATLTPSAPVGISTPYVKPVPTHSVHSHHHWSHSSLPLPEHTQSSSSASIATSAPLAPTSTPLQRTTAVAPVPGSSPSGTVPNQSGNPTTIPPTGSEAQSTTSTICSTRTATITACPSAIPNCPPSSKTTFVTTETVVVSTTVCPVADATQTTSLPSGGKPSGKPDGPEFTTSTIYSTRTDTITACPASVTDCPARSKTTFLTTETIAVSTTVCPVADATQAISSAPSTGEGATKSQDLGSTTSTVFSTRTATITACPSSVTDCPARSKTIFVTTETIAVSTAVCPITEAAGATQTPSASGSTTGKAGSQDSGNGGSESTISTIWSTRVATVYACPASVTNCPLRAKTTYLTTETLAVGMTAYAVSVQPTFSPESVTVTAVIAVGESQAIAPVTASPQGTAGVSSGLSGAAAVYTALYTVESCGSNGACTEYVSTVVMAQTSTSVAQATITSSLFKPVYGSGASGVPSASAWSLRVGSQGSQGGQGTGVGSTGASSTSSAAYAVYTGAASDSLQLSMLKMVGTAIMMLVAILA
ncbi:hypothetical protein N7454_010781 [Penicillium verhagenii]|nr:hypothetical protein N7454_010781 [Penicillium verhagenii]